MNEMCLYLSVFKENLWKSDLQGLRITLNFMFSDASTTNYIREHIGLKIPPQKPRTIQAKLCAWLSLIELLPSNAHTHTHSQTVTHTCFELTYDPLLGHL